MALIKFSILSLYCRIFPTRTLKLGAYILGIIVLLWWLATILVSFFQCQPIAMNWNRALSGTGGHCLDDVKFFLGNAIPNVVTDVLILALPVREVWQLQLPKSQKLAVVGMFLLGGLSVP